VIRALATGAEGTRFRELVCVDFFKTPTVYSLEALEQFSSTRPLTMGETFSFIGELV